MSKIIVILILIITPLFPLATPNVFAFFHDRSTTQSCSASGIDYSPKFFFANPGQITLAFTISNENTLNILRGKRVYLHFGGLGGGVAGIGTDYVDSDQVTVNDSGFSLTLDDDRIEREGPHSGALHWEYGSGQTRELCSQVNYQVGTGAGGRCTIDPGLPNEIPPGSSLTIKFVGMANTEYRLSRGTGDAASTNVLATTRTKDNGQGVFDSVPIPGNNGDNVTLTIWNPNAAIETVCSKTIRISITALPPQPPAPGPVMPAPPGAPAGTPAAAGGIPCGDANNPGFKTAIGCIHTNPVELVKDFLKFGLGIAGGLAFLLMLLGAFQMLTSAGNPDTLNAGRERLSSAVIGLLLVIFSVLLLQIIGIGILDIPGFTG